VSVGQARQTLESLIDDRKVLSRQLAELRNQEQDEDDEPAAKVLSVCLSVCLIYLSFSLPVCQLDPVPFVSIFFKHCVIELSPSNHYNLCFSNI